MAEQIILSGITPIELQKLIITGVKEEIEKLLTKLDTTEQKQQSYLTIKEACEILKCSETKLWRLRGKGKINSIKSERRVLINSDELEAYLSNLMEKGGQK